MIPSGHSKIRKLVSLPLLFLAGIWYNPPVIHEIGHAIGFLITGGIPAAIWWDRMAAVGGSQAIGRIAGPLGAIWIYAALAVFFFNRNPYLSAYCAGAAHEKLIHARNDGFMDLQYFFTDIGIDVTVLGAIAIAVYWLMWVLKFFSPHYSLPWDRKREKQEVEQYLKEIGLTKPNR